ncbi:nucleoredoxin-like protein 1 [Cyanistes caeruleus]|uniref:nucleoredoxin-like protein 1 n=1 Tax=Cyanistes caeruleus TaxID=156563 RepID=UPI000CDA2F78|nr:nucleoredoxin-like protein 1 [Cyanistes caeruleus]
MIPKVIQGILGDPKSPPGRSQSSGRIPKVIQGIQEDPKAAPGGSRVTQVSSGDPGDPGEGQVTQVTPLTSPLPRRELQLRFGVSEPPAVVVLGPGGSVLAGNAVPEIGQAGAACFQRWREAAELLDRNFQEPQEAEGSVRRSLTEPLRRLKYRLRERQEEEEEEGKEEEEGE